MKVAFYIGSFNPWHEGHTDIVNKAGKLFDKIVVMQMSSPSKPVPESLYQQKIIAEGIKAEVEWLERHNMSIIKAVGNYFLGAESGNQYALIRGLRNERDFCEEQILQDIYEDMGLNIPIFFIISDKLVRHYSSTMIKGMDEAAAMDRVIDFIDTEENICSEKS